MEYVILNNGVKMPKLGLGVFRVENLDECEELVYQAIKTGYRLIDTAAAYGNEKAVGRAIKRSGVERSELFITSKLWVSDASYEGAKRGLQRSLENLGLDYIDLYLIHQPVGDIYGAWRALSESYKEGKIRAIGVDNMNQAKLVEFIHFTDVKPAINMIEANVFHQRKEDLKAMEERGIQMEAWAPFSAGGGNIFEIPELKEISGKYGKSVAQVILRWFMQRNIVAIPKTANPKRLKENLDVFDFELTESEMDIIYNLDQGGGHSLPDTAEQFENFLNVLDAYTENVEK